MVKNLQVGVYNLYIMLHVSVAQSSCYIFVVLCMCCICIAHCFDIVHTLYSTVLVLYTCYIIQSFIFNSLCFILILLYGHSTVYSLYTISLMLYIVL